MIARGQNGVVFEAGDAESLAVALGALGALTARERTHPSGAARGTVVARLDPYAVASERVNRYRAIAAEGSAGLGTRLRDGVMNRVGGSAS